MIHSSTRGDIHRYKGLPMLNQSAIRYIIEHGIQDFASKEVTLLQSEEPPPLEKEKTHWIIGGGVDVRITMGKEDFDFMYHQSKLIQKPGPKSVLVLKEAFERAVASSTSVGSLRDHLMDVYEASEYHQFYMNRRADTYDSDKRINILLDEFGDAYWQDLKDAMGKQILSEEEHDLIREISQNILTHKFTTGLFDHGENGRDIIFQYIGTFKYNGVDCKFMVDMIIVDHVNMVIRLVDFKTIGDYILMFHWAVKKRRYDIQADFYTYGVSKNMENIATLLGRPEVIYYEIANFGFVAESTTAPGTPLIFPMTTGALEQARSGDGRYLKGWQDTVDVYKGWADCGFDLDNRFAHQNGVIRVDATFDYLDQF